MVRKANGSRQRAPDDRLRVLAIPGENGEREKSEPVAQIEGDSPFAFAQTSAMIGSVERI